jgi:alpha-N-acetylglucosamine transferase
LQNKYQKNITNNQIRLEKFLKMFEILYEYGSVVKNSLVNTYEYYSIGRNKNKRCAWITLICNDEYSPGVLALARSLKRSKTIYPLIVMIVKDNLSEDVIQQIQNEECSIKYVEGLYPNQQLTSLAFQHFMYAWTKLRAFEMVDVADECVFLDCDMIVLQNMDELFQLEDKPDFAAIQTCICNPAKTLSYHEYWNSTNCPHTYDQTSNDLPNIDERAHMFNAGFFLFHPNKNVYEQMFKCLNTWDLDEFKFAEQDFLNKFYKNKWKCLPSIYNSLKTFSVTHPNIWNLSKIKIIHFILAKPWNKTDQDNQLYENINQLWWKAFEYRSP